MTIRAARGSKARTREGERWTTVIAAVRLAVLDPADGRRAVLPAAKNQIVAAQAEN
jgi:hypothetical protein